MDIYTTPIRNFSPHQSYESTSPSSISKQYVLDLIDSLDFNELVLPPHFFNSENEDDTPSLMEVIGHVLTDVMVKKSPPRMSPKRLLQSSTSQASNELDTLTKMPKGPQDDDEDEYLTRRPIDPFGDDPKATSRRLKMLEEFAPFLENSTRGNIFPAF